MNNLFQDLRYGVRMLMKRPGFTLIATITLALGIGANAAIFSVVNAILLRSLPYEDPARLVMLKNAPITLSTQLSPAGLIDWRDRAQSFERLAAYRISGGGVNLTNTDEPERVAATEVTSDFFPTMGVTPIAGRAFLPEDESSGGNRVAIISYGLWQRRFGGDTGFVGQAISLSGIGFTVIGIAPQGFDYPGDIDIWVPPSFGKDRVISGSAIVYNVIGRLKSDTTLQQAQAEMAAFSEWLKQEFPNRSASRRAVETISLHDDLVGNTRPALLILLGATAFVLLISCANVSNLLLARGSARQKEIAIRAALGAGRWRLIRQLLVESLLLSLLGGAMGLLFAWWGVDLLIALGPAEVPRLNEVSLDRTVLGFTMAVSIISGIVFGLLPAFQASRVDLNESLKEGASKAGTAGRLRGVRGLLVIAEVAMALVLLTGAGLLIRSFIRLHDVNSGIDPENVLTVVFSQTGPKYADGEKRAAFYREAIERLNALPGARAVSAINYLPLGKAAAVGLLFSIEGMPKEIQGKDRFAMNMLIAPDYFNAMGIPVLQGRDFSDRDANGSQPVAIINQTFARRFWPDESPLGKRLSITGEEAPCEIIAVVGDVRHWGLETETEMEVYRPYLQAGPSLSALVISANADPKDMVDAVRSEIKSLDADLPLYDIKTMRERLSESVAKRRFTLLLLAAFAALALILAAVGIYGVVSYGVSRRTHEIGIRMALGAGPRDVMKLILRQSMFMSLAGVAIGLGAAYALTRLMESLLYEVSATDPLTFAFVALLLAGVAFAACYIPARRATRADPMVALRYE